VRLIFELPPASYRAARPYLRYDNPRLIVFDDRAGNETSTRASRNQTISGYRTLGFKRSSIPGQTIQKPGSPDRMTHADKNGIIIGVPRGFAGGTVS
jgi:hypothetical protein